MKKMILFVTTLVLFGAGCSVKVHDGARSGGRRSVTLNGADFTRLVLGHLDLRAPQTAERVQASSAKAFEIAAALFPQLPLWTPPWDGLGL